MNECIFCKIIDGSADANIVYSDSEMIAFTDISPKAKVHILLVPRAHIFSLNSAEDRADLLGSLMSRVVAIAKQAEIAESGYRVVVNTGEDSGQIVHHLHLHILGGEKLMK